MMFYVWFTFKPTSTKGNKTKVILNCESLAIAAKVYGNVLCDLRCSHAYYGANPPSFQRRRKGTDYRHKNYDVFTIPVEEYPLLSSIIKKSTKDTTQNSF